jgi:hypothetical protein
VQRPGLRCLLSAQYLYLLLKRGNSRAVISVVAFPALICFLLSNKQPLALLSKIPLLRKLVLLLRCIKNVLLKRKLNFQVALCRCPFGRIGAGRLCCVLPQLRARLVVLPLRIV